MPVKETAEIAAKRQSAAYIAHANLLNRSQPDLSEKEIDALSLEACDQAVYGFDAKKVKGKYVPQGIGSPGHETGNHFAAILRYQGKEAYEEAVREIQKRDPKRHAELGLPKLAPKAA